ncbi:hypothetical protein AVEN_242715-1 [Araneus ventricosus]|uniref:Uncharacterized protein n=1 Tax=Araneus ventricosus TaxID=182803 RepID=A0A4Y2DYT7_ARAVE|nr:hypothetical protein AVEN_242715-1 [Araneus ventricosus]
MSTLPNENVDNGNDGEIIPPSFQNVPKCRKHWRLSTIECELIFWGRANVPENARPGDIDRIHEFNLYRRVFKVETQGISIVAPGLAIRQKEIRH